MHPSGIWGDYSYLPAVSFIGAVPGHKNTAKFSWENLETIVDDEGVPIYSIWESSSAYDDWYPADGDTFIEVYYLILVKMMGIIILIMKNFQSIILMGINNITLIMKIEKS